MGDAFVAFIEIWCEIPFLKNFAGLELRIYFELKFEAESFWSANEVLGVDKDTTGVDLRVSIEKRKKL